MSSSFISRYGLLFLDELTFAISNSAHSKFHGDPLVLASEDYCRNRDVSDAVHRRIAKLTYERDFRTKGRAERVVDQDYDHFRKGKTRKRPRSGIDEDDDENRPRVLRRLAKQLEDSWMISPGREHPYIAVSQGETEPPEVDVSGALMAASTAITDVVAFLRPRGKIAAARF